MAYEDMIRNYSDPDRFKRQGKAQAIGAALAALLSGVAKKNLVPGYMSGVERVQEQQQQQRMMERMQMQDMMAVKKHEADMRQMDLINKQREMQMAQAEKQMAAQQKYAEFVTKNEREERMQSIKEGKERLGGITDFVGKMSQMAGQVSPSLGKAGEAVTGRMKESVGKVEQKAKAGVEADIGQMRDILSVAPELAPQMGIEPILGKRAQKAEERADMDWELQRKINLQVYESNKKAAEAGDINSQAFMDLLNSEGDYSSLSKYTPEAQDYAVTKYQDYKGREKQIRLMGQKAGPKPPPQMKQYKNMQELLSDKSMTNADVEAVLSPYRTSIEDGNIEDLKFVIQRQMAMNPEDGVAFATDVINNIMPTIKTKLKPTEVDKWLGNKGYRVMGGDVYDYAGNPIDNNNDGFPDSKMEIMATEGWTAKGAGYEQPNNMVTQWRADRAGFVKNLMTGAEPPAEKVVVKPPITPTTPLGEKLAENKVKQDEKKANRKGRDLSKLAESEAKDTIDTLLRTWWRPADPLFAQKKIQEQLSTPEGVDELKLYLSDEEGKPYDQTTLNLILINIQEMVDKMVEGTEKRLGRTEADQLKWGVQ